MHKPLPSLTVTSQGMKRPRPFSSVFMSMELQRYKDIEEIEEIKNRMAKHKISISIDKLQLALLVPDEIKDLEKLN